MQTFSKNKHCPVLVSFSGIDGSGKSTQIEALRTWLKGNGLRVHLVTFWDDVARLKGVREASGHALFKGEKGIGSPSRPINRRDKNVRAWYMTMVRFGLYLVDAISLRNVVKRAQQSDANVVIFDRYHYDELANLGMGSRIVRAYVRLILWLVPPPNIAFLLDADPVLARARKPEYPVDFLQTSRTSYLNLARLAGMTVIAPQPIEDVEREISRRVLDELPPAILSRKLEDLQGGQPSVTETRQGSLGAESGEARPSTA